MDVPFVSVIIPCRNEERFIGRCLDSVISQDYPREKLEVLVVDGMSKDRTASKVTEYLEKNAFVRLLENSGRIVPAALNLGIGRARGEIIVRMDAHSTYPRDYISKCVRALLEYGVDNVGGLLITLPGDRTVTAEAIALAISHPFGVGNAHYRIGAKKPRFVDTVPYGCYRREVFEKVGLFDEGLVRNQDDEFNLRLIRNGCKILLVPGIVSYYYARDSLSKLSKMFYQYGFFKPLVARKIGAVLTWRQLVPVLYVSGLLALGLLALVARPFLWTFLFVLISYLVVTAGFSFATAVKKGLKYFFTLPVVFATIHFSYGLGYLKGILDFVLLQKDKKKKITDVSLTR